MASPVYVWHGSSQDDADATWNSATIAYLTLELALAAVDAGGIVYVASEHVQTQAADLTCGSTSGTLAAPVTIISVNKDDSDAYLAMVDDAAPGKIETTGASDINISNSDIFIGLTFNVGDDLRLIHPNNNYIMIDCKFAVDDIMNIGQTTYDIDVFWFNCVYEQITTGYWVIDRASTFTWKGGTFSFNGGDINAVGIFNITNGAHVEVSDVDFQDLDGGDALVSIGQSTIGSCLFKRCKVPAGIGGLVDSVPVSPNQSAKFYSVSSSDIIYQLQENYYTGQINEDTAIYLSATYDGTNGYSYKMVSSANAIEWTRPLRFKLAEIYTAANPTLTVELNLDSATALNDDDFWVEIEYPDETTGALGTLDQTSRATTITTTPAALTSSAKSWTGTGAFGDEQKRSVSVTIAAGQAGAHTIWACLAKPSTTIYVCPKIVVT